MYDNCPTQNDLENLILSAENKKPILNYLKESESNNDSLRMGQLRIKARNLGIANWYNLSRNTLIEQITKLESYESQYPRTPKSIERVDG